MCWLCSLCNPSSLPVVIFPSETLADPPIVPARFAALSRPYCQPFFTQINCLNSSIVHDLAPLLRSPLERHRDSRTMYVRNKYIRVSESRLKPVCRMDMHLKHCGNLLSVLKPDSPQTQHWNSEMISTLLFSQRSVKFNPTTRKTLKTNSMFLI